MILSSSKRRRDDEEERRDDSLWSMSKGFPPTPLTTIHAQIRPRRLLMDEYEVKKVGDD